MADKTELLEKSKQYFNNQEVKIMYATTDGNFFYEEHFANSHAKGLGTQVITIKRAELAVPKEKKEKEATLADLTVKLLKAKCEEAEYDKEEWKKLNKTDLIEYIELKSNETPSDSEENDSGKNKENDSNRYEEYETDTGKNAVWNNTETKAYNNWLKDN